MKKVKIPPYLGIQYFIALIWTVLSLCACGTNFGPSSLTAQKANELRPVMERYFQVLEKAYQTLDRSELTTIATNGELVELDGWVQDRGDIPLYIEIKIRSFNVVEYSTEKAKVFVSTQRTNAYEIDSQTGQRTFFADEYDGIFYTLVKDDGVWKVSGGETLR